MKKYLIELNITILTVFVTSLTACVDESLTKEEQVSQLLIRKTAASKVWKMKSIKAIKIQIYKKLFRVDFQILKN